MRPIMIRFQCFGPYMKKQEIWFDKLENGLFLICGETGAGKTTILDAMSYALFGQSSGGLRGDISVMRCKLAGKDDETLVEFLFEQSGERYLFTRRLRIGRKNLIDEHNCLIEKDGQFVPIYENPKKSVVNKKAEELLGLNADQFRQVVILPQGKFEKFLVSDSTQKEEILVTLFKADKWQRLVDEICRRVYEEDAALSKERMNVENTLSAYKTSEGAPCKSLEELRCRIEELAADLEEGRALQTDKEKELAAKKYIYENALVLDQQFAELSKRSKRSAALEERSAEMKEREGYLSRCDEAQLLRTPYEEKERAAKELIQAKTREEAALTSTEHAKGALLLAEKSWKEHVAGKAGYDADCKRVVELSQYEKLYADLEEKKKEGSAAQSEYLARKKNYEAKRSLFEKATEEWKKAFEAQGEALRAHQEALALYMAGISGTLAQNLKKGMPCPVCGSTEHPSPAKITDQTVTDAKLNQRSKEMRDAAKELEIKTSLRSEAEKAYAEATEQFNAAVQIFRAAKAAYELLKEQCKDGIASLKELKQEEAKLTQKIKAYEEKEAKLREQVTEMTGRVKAALQMYEERKLEVQTAWDAAENTCTMWEQTLLMSTFAKESEFQLHLLEAQDRAKLQKELAEYQADRKSARDAVVEQKALVEGKERPDLVLLKAEVDTLSRDVSARSNALAIAEKEVQDMRQTAESLAKRMERYEERRRSYEANAEFAQRLRGSSGLSLQRYVLGVMLSSVTVHANELLKNVHGGRYQLYRSDESAGSSRKKGLELEVFDARNGERRSVTTLSGGEKFLVALSLAIGLSTVVQAQGSGVRLGAMFIDEGFGSLDEHSITDALTVLQGIQRNNGLVGIISHVAALEDAIDQKLYVTKGEKGSEIVTN